MNHKDSSIQVFGKVVRYPAVRMLLIGFLLLLVGQAFSMNGPVIDTRFAPLGDIITVSTVNNQIANGVAEDELIITVTDGLGNPVPGLIFSFTIGGTFVNSNLTTDAAGVITYGLAGGSVGATQIIVTFGGVPIAGSPFTFNYIAGPVSAANPLTQLVVDVPVSPPDGSTADVLHAHVVDATGNPISNATVDFTITGGTASGTAVVSPGLSLLTDVNGNASINITNLKSGTVTFTATANGVSITNNSPATVTFVATTPSVANPLTRLTVDVTGSPPDGITADILHAHIADVNGNPVPNVTVVFTISGGTAAGTAVTTTLTVTTNAAGDAAVALTNIKSGTVSFTATVGGVNIPTGSPATVDFIATTPSLTNPNTRLVVDRTNEPPDGVSFDRIHARILDINGNPVVNVTVIFTITGGTAAGTAVTTTLTATTNAVGDATVDITNLKSGTVIFTATVGGVNIPNGSPAVVQFIATTPSVTNPLTQLIVDVPTSPPDGVSADVIHAHIVDVTWQSSYRIPP